MQRVLRTDRHVARGHGRALEPDFPLPRHSLPLAKDRLVFAIRGVREDLLVILPGVGHQGDVDQDKLFDLEVFGQADQGRHFMDVVFEKESDGFWTGLTDNYIRVFVKSNMNLNNQLLPIKILELKGEGVLGEVLPLERKKI